MTPAQLDELLHANIRDGKHGERNCPKCGLGYMAYLPVASSSVYSCQKCAWLEYGHPPWPKRNQSQNSH